LHVPTVLIPAPLRRLTAGQSRVAVDAATVRELLDRLDAAHPGVRAYLLDETGALRAYVNVFVNATEIRQAAGLATPLRPADEVTILPAMAGGRAGPRR
jgi:molybdopterin synthase sulfur carrier subunit